MKEQVYRKMKHYIAYNKAMTLVEAIIVIVLITIMIAAAIAPYILQQQILRRQFTLSRLQDDVSVALATISKDIMQAYEVDDSVAGQYTLNIDKDLGTGNPTTIIVYDYTPAAGTGTITRSPDSATTVDLITNVTNFTFNVTPRNYVDLSITCERDGFSITQVTGIGLRAVAAD